MKKVILAVFLALYLGMLAMPEGEIPVCDLTITHDWIDRDCYPR